jgi:hypothetical protein
MSSVAPEKKATVKETHRLAIEHFKKWLARNPNATHGSKFEKFDETIDLAALVREERRKR